MITYVFDVAPDIVALEGTLALWSGFLVRF
jgi:hypothetical protein